MFNQHQEPGLSNLMVGHAAPSEVHAEEQRAGAMAADRRAHSAESRGAARLEALQGLHPDRCASHFDSVIIDSPPIMAVTDAAIAASSTNGIVFVIGAEMTSRQAARTAVEQLEKSRPGFIGAVLNRVDLERNGYYYSNYYRRKYGQYYHQPAAKSS